MMFVIKPCYPLEPVRVTACASSQPTATNTTFSVNITYV